MPHEPEPGSVDTSAAERIRIRGARVHNLKNIDLDIPRNQFIVFTGISGSGKSTLAFDTLFAEGQRRFIETLSAYARQMLDQTDPPEVDMIDGLPPTVAIDQKASLPNPRSTVATITEVHDYLRLLFARAGIPNCPNCDLPIGRQTPEQMTETALSLPDSTRVVVLAPLVNGRKGEHLEFFAVIRQAGLIRARVDGEILDVSEKPPKLASTKTHTIEAVVDRLVIRDGIRPRLAESIDRAVKLSEGTVILSIQETDGSWADRILSSKLSCPGCGYGLESLETRSFSFNSPYGACSSCGGLGHATQFDQELVLPDLSLSLINGAVEPWRALGPKEAQDLLDNRELDGFLKGNGIGRETQLNDWPKKTLDHFWLGQTKAKAWQIGLHARLEQALKNAKTVRQRESLEMFQSYIPCPACQGARLKPSSLAVRLGGHSIAELLALRVLPFVKFLAGLTFDSALELIAPPLVAEICKRLEYLERVGLEYLTLDRPADTLSGGELQRVRLASQIGSGLVGVCFVLDEPTAGLHPRDSERLLETLKRLRDDGNSVLVVEHDETIIRAADWIIDLGPGAGPEGGRVVAQGTPTTFNHPESVTAAFLHKPPRSLPEPSGRLERSPGKIEILNATEHNLKGINVSIPLGSLVCVSGMSGSGKSTLVQDVLNRATRKALGQIGPRPGSHDKILGLEQIAGLVDVDQGPIGRSARSTPATYTGVFDEIRKIFAMLRESKIRGYKATRFSFNDREGRCETCLGQGQRKIEMQFMPDLFVKCESCNGHRFNIPTLEVRYKGKTIADVMNLRVDEALAFFDATPKVRVGLQALQDAGLSYMTLGQSSTTLSGGEAQRVKLAAELARVGGANSLYVLDEPTTGLHAADVQNLVRVLQQLANQGQTVVVIEHNLDLIRAADWVIDLGPEGGDQGGELLAQGPPSVIANTARSYTGQFLRQSLPNDQSPRRNTPKF